MSIPQKCIIVTRITPIPRDGMSCHYWKTCFTFLFLPSKTRCVEKEPKTLQIGIHLSKKDLTCPCPTVTSDGPADISKLPFIYLFQLMQSIINWVYNAKLTTTDPAGVYATSLAKKQPVCSNNDCIYPQQ